MSASRPTPTELGCAILAWIVVIALLGAWGCSAIWSAPFWPVAALIFAVGAFWRIVVKN